MLFSAEEKLIWKRHVGAAFRGRPLLYIDGSRPRAAFTEGYHRTNEQSPNQATVLRRWCGVSRTKRGNRSRHYFGWRRQSLAVAEGPCGQRRIHRRRRDA